MKSKTFGNSELVAIFDSQDSLPDPLSVKERGRSRRLYDAGVIVELLLLDLDDVPVAVESTDNNDGLILGKPSLRERLWSRLELDFMGWR